MPAIGRLSRATVFCRVTAPDPATHPRSTGTDAPDNVEKTGFTHEPGLAGAGDGHARAIGRARGVKAVGGPDQLATVGVMLPKLNPELQLNVADSAWPRTAQARGLASNGPLAIGFRP
jgi:hypothetical protein